MMKELIDKAREISEKSEYEGIMVISRLNDKCMPFDRGDLYEVPLDDWLKNKGYGEVSGGGTMKMLDNEFKDGVEFCDLEIIIMKIEEDVFQSLISKLNDLGAPKGSKLLIGSEDDYIIMYPKIRTVI